MDVVASEDDVLRAVLWYTHGYLQVDPPPPRPTPFPPAPGAIPRPPHRHTGAAGVCPTFRGHRGGCPVRSGDAGVYTTAIHKRSRAWRGRSHY